MLNGEAAFSGSAIPLEFFPRSLHQLDEVSNLLTPFQGSLWFLWQLGCVRNSGSAGAQLPGVLEGVRDQDSLCRVGQCHHPLWQQNWAAHVPCCPEGALLIVPGAGALVLLEDKGFGCCLRISVPSQGLGVRDKPGSEKSCASFLAQNLHPLASAPSHSNLPHFSSPALVALFIWDFFQL